MPHTTFGNDESGSRVPEERLEGRIGYLPGCAPTCRKKPLDRRTRWENVRSSRRGRPCTPGPRAVEPYAATSRPLVILARLALVATAGWSNDVDRNPSANGSRATSAELAAGKTGCHAVRGARWGQRTTPVSRTQRTSRVAIVSTRV